MKEIIYCSPKILKCVFKGIAAKCSKGTEHSSKLPWKLQRYRNTFKSIAKAPKAWQQTVKVLRKLRRYGPLGSVRSAARPSARARPFGQCPFALFVRPIARPPPARLDPRGEYSPRHKKIAP